jgi:hypothetical protein
VQNDLLWVPRLQKNSQKRAWCVRSDGGDGGDAYDNGDGDGDEGNDNDNGDADGDGDGEGDGDGGDDEEVVVSNEDITNGGDYDPFDDFILAQVSHCERLVEGCESCTCFSDQPRFLVV